MSNLSNGVRISRDRMFCDIVEIIAHRSTCLRSQVGALIVKDGRIISIGYNGPASGQPDCEELPSNAWMDVDTYLEAHPSVCMGAGCDRSIHAELNAIVFAARVGVSVEGCTMYCSMDPCINCAKAIVNSGINELVYRKKYRRSEGLNLLRESGIVVRQFVEDDTIEEKIIDEH